MAANAAATTDLQPRTKDSGGIGLGISMAMLISPLRTRHPTHRFGGTPAAPVVPESVRGSRGSDDKSRLRLVSLRTGEPLPGPASESAWISPAGGRIVTSPVHSGLAAAEVTNPSGEYALWRQPLAVSSLRAGTRLRLSAWVKGQGIRPGDVSWKVGAVRFAVTTEKTQ